MNILSSKKGFTLMELLVVIGILAVLAFVTVPSIAGLIEKARMSNDAQDIRAMELALNLCAVDGRSYLSAEFDMPQFEAVLEQTSDVEESHSVLTNNRCNGAFDKDFFSKNKQSI